MTEDALMLSHVARIRHGYTSEQLATLNARLVERDIELDEKDLYFFRAEISNTLLDSHFTHMSVRTLQNYEEDANSGVAFLRGHNWNELPLGYSVSAQYEAGTKQRTVADFYTVPGMSDTDDLIKRLKTGLVRDVSVGFHGGRAICDLCGQDFWDCRHFPGLKYEEKEGDTVKTQLATFTIDDARLSEVSGVFDGSTPEAMILKAQRAAKAGNLTRSQVALLENQYRVALPFTSRFAVADNRGVIHWDMKDGTITERKVEMELDLTPVRSALGVKEDAEIQPAVDKLVKRVAELEPQAKDGLAYREDLVQEALAEGVRAQGTDFEKTEYEEMLRKSPISLIKRFRDDWKKVADKALPTGRQSSDETQQPTKPSKADLVPDRAYA